MTWSIRRRDRQAELREILEDEPDWKDVLRVVTIELDGELSDELGGGTKAGRGLGTGDRFQ